MQRPNGPIIHYRIWPRNSLFLTRFLKNKANHVKDSNICKLKIYSIEADPGKLNISDCLVVVSYQGWYYADTEIMYNHIEKITHIVVYVPIQ